MENECCRCSEAGHGHAMLAIGNSLRYRRRFSDFANIPTNNLWTGFRTSGFSDSKVYVVQTNPGIIERCNLDDHRPRRPRARPHLRSGTTATVAEQWGRRWITIDTRAWRWRSHAHASWERAIRSTCWPTLAMASLRKPKSPAPRRVPSLCRATSAMGSSMSACRTLRSSPSPTTRRSRSSGASGRSNWSHCESR